MVGGWVADVCGVCGLACEIEFVIREKIEENLNVTCKNAINSNEM